VLKVFFDCQIFQTEAFNRGMGKYSLSLLTELFKSKQYKSKHQTVFVFNKNLPLLKDSLKQIQSINKEAAIVEVDLPIKPVGDTQKKYLNASKQLDEILKANLRPSEESVFILLAPFFVDFVSAFPTIKNIRKISIIYDIIPQLIWKKQRIFPDELYFNHYRLFREADKLLTISESVRQDLIHLVGVAEDKIKTIDGGPFNKAGITRHKKENNYILFPSAPIVHKNNINAVRGFDEFNKLNGNKYKLIITSNFDEKSKSDLEKLSSNLYFTGNVSNVELAGFYQGCNAVLFASLCEGLGMPVLESVNYTKPVACSDIAVLKEISSKGFYFFNPLSPKSIANALTLAVNRRGWKEKLSNYEKIGNKYTWKRTAQIFAKEMKEKSANVNNKPKINIRCPDPHVESGVAKLIEKIYFSLARYYELSIIYKKAWRRSSPSYIPYISQNTKMDRPTIFITNSLRKPTAYFRPNKDTHIAVVNKIQTLLSFTNSHKPDFTLFSKKKIYNNVLRINEWVYSDKESEKEFSIKNSPLSKILKNIIRN